MYDIFVVSKTKVQDQFLNNIRIKYPSAQKIDNVENFDQIKNKAFTKMFWVIWDDILLDDNFDLNSYKATKWDDQYIHVFLNHSSFDGLGLFPKSAHISTKEFKHRFYNNKKQIDIVASRPKSFDIFYIETFEQYQEALKTASTEMFWALSYNIKVKDTFNLNFYFSHNDVYNRNQNHVFIHRLPDKDLFNGVLLLSKNKIITKKEIEFRFPVERKEWNIVASEPVKYDRFVIKNFEDYLDAYDKAKTELFWIIPDEVQVNKGFNFDVYFSHDNYYDRSMHHGFKHIFRNNETYNGITLVSKKNKLTKKEIDFRFIIEKKEWNVIASSLKPYDIMFISYNETNADTNFKILQNKFPRSKRIHGVKGIHQAHIRAAELSDTEMFFVVDGDAIIENDFKFDYEVPVYERDTVHVWRSKNPINNLEYGYGGVKLLPRKLTLEMDVNSSDMTTSISKKFKVIPEISNISAFNTDEFSTWRSAFRECCKLSSEIIDRQDTSESIKRLDIWCNVAQGDYADYAIQGAIAGRKYGEQNKGNLEALVKINNFNWLKEQFDAR